MGSPVTDDTDDTALVRDVLARVGDKWSVVVICQLGDGTLRFNELRRRAAPVTQRMLSSTLRGLARDGLVLRTVQDTSPPQVSYTLTPLGLSLLDVVLHLAQWVDQNAADIARSRAEFDRAGAGH